jgi:hypothetical protein
MGKQLPDYLETTMLTPDSQSKGQLHIETSTLTDSEEHSTATTQQQGDLNGPMVTVAKATAQNLA